MICGKQQPYLLEKKQSPSSSSSAASAAGSCWRRSASLADWRSTSASNFSRKVVLRLTSERHDWRTQCFGFLQNKEADYEAIQQDHAAAFVKLLVAAFEKETFTNSVKVLSQTAGGSN